MYSDKIASTKQLKGASLRNSGSPGNLATTALVDNRAAFNNNQNASVTHSPLTIQREIRSPFVEKTTDISINDIQREIVRYNILQAKGHSFLQRKAALQQLSLIETLVYQWFGNQQEMDLDAKPLALKMKGLMNELQRERIYLVTQSIKSHDAEPPVAGFDHLPKIIQHQISFLWQRLLKREGIEISGDADFFMKMMADFSRLLQVDMGRRLIQGIVITNKGLKITPVAATGKFAARPDDPEKESMTRVKPVVSGAASSSSSSSGDVSGDLDTSEFVRVDFREKNKAQRLDILQDLRVRNAGSKGVSIRSEMGDAHFAFAEGVGSRITVPDGMHDASRHSSSRMADERGFELIAPTFITLGHELGHVLRSAQGMSASEDGSALIKHGFPGVENHDRPEEFFNIGGVENSLRLESGIMPRHGHGNLYSFWAVKAMNSVEKMERQLELLMPAYKDTRDERKLKNIKVDIDTYLRPKILALMGGKGSITEVLKLLSKLKLELLDMATG